MPRLSGELRPWDPDAHTFSFGGHTIQGLGKDEFLDIQFDSDEFEDEVGVDGEVSRSRNADERADIRLTLMRTSRTNAYLTKVLQAQKTLGLSIPAPFGITDGAGQQVALAPLTWIKTRPPMKGAKMAGEVTWVLRTSGFAILDYTHNDTAELE